MNVMNRKLITTVWLLALLLCVGCKTTEQNYKNAYETARQHQAERQGVDLPDGATLKNPDVPDPRPVVIDGVELPMVTAWVLTADKAVTPLDSLGKFTVVVAQFKQIFNASQMRDRLASSNGLKPVILKMANGYYLVGAYTTNDPSQALEDYNRIKDDKSIMLKEPFPFIFRTGQLSR